MKNHPVITRILQNGLTLKLKEMHSAPLISHWVWVRVGSRCEEPGKKGLSHWVEHMQFKGTRRFSSSEMDKLVAREGGVWNAFTFIDWTTYFETMPAEKIDLAFELESDRFRNSTFASEEVDSERTVIISELEGSENEPMYRLSKAVNEAAFVKHPYHFETIGTTEDLRAITRQDLYEYYRNHYVANNAIVVLAGDFDAEAMLEKLEKYYGKLPSGVPKNCDIEQEPPQTEERKVEVKGPGETSFIQVAYHAPEAKHPDFFPFSVLDSLLTGPSSFNMFGGGGISNKTSRMYRRLVEKSLAVSIGGGLQATIDPFLYEIAATIHPRSNHAAVLKAIDQEIEIILEKPISQAEVDRAVKQAKALFAYGSENITNQAFWLGFADMFADYSWFSHFVERLEQVTPAEVQQVARKYLLKTNRVVGTYIPSNNGGKA